MPSPTSNLITEIFWIIECGRRQYQSHELEAEPVAGCQLVHGETQLSTYSRQGRPKLHKCVQVVREIKVVLASTG